jgi:hypothetical protein
VAEDREHGIFPDALGRAPGEPLSHPKIATSDRERLLRHWQDKKASSTPRDWGALYMGNPKPVEGALVAREILRRQRHYDTVVEPIRKAVSIDPSGGGRDTAGVCAGFLGADRKVYLTHDLSGTMSSDEWAEKACQLAFDTGADRILVEKNFGGDMTTKLVRAAWADLVRAGKITPTYLPPQIIPVNAKQGKRLRAEPIAAQMVLDNVRFAGPMSEMEDEWATWQATSTTSPGRIDASVHLVVGLLPIAGIQAIAGTVASPVRVSRKAAVGHGDAGMPYIPRGRSGPGGGRVISIDSVRSKRLGVRFPGG